MNDNTSNAKELLDRLISKQRAHMYKVIHVAEILINIPFCYTMYIRFYQFIQNFGWNGIIFK